MVQTTQPTLKTVRNTPFPRLHVVCANSIFLGTAKKKWGIIAALGACTLITPLASSFFAPGVPQVMRTFHEDSNLLAAFVVSIYILG